MKSMTGYGRGQAEAEGLAVTVELRSVNGRQREVRLRLPPELNERETALRALVQEQVARGRVEVHVAVERPEGRPLTLRCNRTLARRVTEVARELREELGLTGEIDLPAVLATHGVLEVVPDRSDDAEELAATVARALSLALEGHTAAREAEGRRLRADLEERLAAIAEARAAIAVRAPEAVSQAAERLRERVAELAGSVPLDEARLAQEVAYLADRADINEELVRLASHLEEAVSVLEASAGEPVGRRLEFLCQEIQREANTIGQKTGDLEIGRLSLAIKHEVEKLREQVQNVE